MIIKIITASSYRVQNKNSVCQHTPSTHIIYIDIHIISAHGNGLPMFVKRTLGGKGSLDLGLEPRVGRFPRHVCSKFQIDGMVKLKDHLPKDFRLHLGNCKSFLFEDWIVRGCLICLQNEAER